MKTKKPNRKRPPHWLTARFGGGVCSGEGCNEVIRKGDKVFYYPGTRAILAVRCGHAHAAVRAIEEARAKETKLQAYADAMAEEAYADAHGANGGETR